MRNLSCGVEIEIEGRRDGFTRISPASYVGSAARGRDRNASRPSAGRPVAKRRFRAMPSRARPRGDDHSARPRCLRRMLARNLRSRRPPLPLSVYQLHFVRTAIHRRSSAAIRPRHHDAARISSLRPMRARISRSVGSALQGRADRVPAMWSRSVARGLPPAIVSRESLAPATVSPSAAAILRNGGVSRRSRRLAAFISHAMRPMKRPSYVCGQSNERPQKPLAMMVDSLRSAKHLAVVSDA